jgi:co-chaperonin GroES (HSP10)
MKVKPTGTNVLIKAVEIENTTSGGIILKRDVTTGLKPAIVEEIGYDVQRLKPGYQVYPVWSEAKPISIDGAEYAIIKEEHIIAIVTEL